MIHFQRFVFRFAGKLFYLSTAAIVLFLLEGCSNPRPQFADGFDGTVWVTAADKSQLFQQQPSRLTFSDERSPFPSIDIDPVQRLQEIEGFGFSLTGGSAALIDKLADPEKESVLKELVLTDAKNIGVSYLRISIGGSDLDDHPYSYDDMPSGKTDPNLSGFSMAESEKHLIPILKKIIALNPDIKNSRDAMVSSGLDENPIAACVEGASNLNSILCMRTIS